MTTMRNRRVANPIAVRRFSVADEPGREVVLTIGKPRPDPKPGGAFLCSWSSAPTGRTTGRGAGWPGYVVVTAARPTSSCSSSPVIVSRSSSPRATRSSTSR